MTPLIIATALGLLAMDAAPATSQTDAPAPAPAKASAPAKAKAKDDNDLDKVICKTEQITGSRFNKRICMTRAEWGDQERHLQEFQRHINQTPNGQASGGLAGG